MKKRFRRIELTKEGKMITAGAVAAIVLLALLAFFFLFRVDKVYVVGNTRYTDEEVKEYVNVVIDAVKKYSNNGDTSVLSFVKNIQKELEDLITESDTKVLERAYMHDEDISNELEAKLSKYTR